MSRVRTNIAQANLNIVADTDLVGTQYYVQCTFNRTGSKFMLKHIFATRHSAEKMCVKIRKRNSIDFAQWSKS